MTQLLSMPETLRLQKLKFVVSAVSELRQDIELIIQLFFRVSIAHIVVLFGVVPDQIDEGCLRVGL
jgi:hypothetical protein